MLQQGFDLGGESENASVPEVVKGLDSEAVARAEQRLAGCVPDGKREHAAEQLHAIGAVLLVGVEDCFGVAARGVDVAGAFEIGAQQRMIEDFAVVDDPGRAGSSLDMG